MAGLRKSDNPLILQAAARELISNQYNHCICVYTDGSMTTEGVGAAFVVPQLSNLIRKYQLPHVSIFTAELVAILMALNFFNDLCQPQMAVSVFSDTLSALQAVKHNSQSSREDVVKEIVVVCHQLITRGTDIVLQWVPSHVGVPGNDSADRAAKQAARGLGATALHLTLSFTDIKTLLTRAVWKLCGVEFAAKARDSGYTNDLSPPTGTACVSPRCQCTSLQLCTVCVVTCGEPSLSPNCVCAGRWSRPTTLFLSVPHWWVTLNLLLISFDCLICRRTSPVWVVSVTTRGGVWQWTQPS